MKYRCLIMLFGIGAGMTIKRYSPNLHLIAPSTETRMVEDAKGQYVDLREILQLSREELDELLLAALTEDEK